MRQTLKEGRTDTERVMGGRNDRTTARRYSNIKGGSGRMERKVEKGLGERGRERKRG